MQPTQQCKNSDSKIAGSSRRSRDTFRHLSAHRLKDIAYVSRRRRSPFPTSPPPPYPLFLAPFFSRQLCPRHQIRKRVQEESVVRLTRKGTASNQRGSGASLRGKSWRLCRRKGQGTGKDVRRQEGREEGGCQVRQDHLAYQQAVLRPRQPLRRLHQDLAEGA